MNIYLLVYYVKDIEVTKQFLSKLGLDFVQEKHGDGPVHYSTCVGNLVFEIYPQGKNQVTSTRIGIELSEANEGVINFIAENALGNISKMESGKSFAILNDPSGNKIEVAW